MGNIQHAVTETQNNIQYSKVYHHHQLIGLAIIILNDVVSCEKKGDKDRLQKRPNQMPRLFFPIFSGHQWNVDSVH